MQRRILFLLNPKAGVKQKISLPDLIQQRCADAGIDFVMDHTRADGDYSLLKEKILTEKISDVVIAGGDGTISAVTAKLRELPVQFGIIPRGSGNGLAFAARIPKDPNKALDIILKGTANPVDAFLINDHFSCMLSGLGFDAQVAHDFDGQTKRGFWKYAELTLKNVTGIKPYAFHLKSKEVDLSMKAYFISIANSNQFGNQFTIAPKASLQDGKLDIVAVEKNNLLSVLAKVLWHINYGTFTKDFKKHYGITYFQTTELVIENPELAPFHIDGDGKQTSKQFTVSVIPKAYSLLMP